MLDYLIVFELQLLAKAVITDGENKLRRKLSRRRRRWLRRQRWRWRWRRCQRRCWRRSQRRKSFQQTRKVDGGRNVKQIFDDPKISNREHFLSKINEQKTNISSFLLFFARPYSTRKKCPIIKLNVLNFYCLSNECIILFLNISCCLLKHCAAKVS